MPGAVERETGAILSLSGCGRGILTPPRLRAGIEHETEGVTLVSTRHSARPLHSYIEWLLHADTQPTILADRIRPAQASFFVPYLPVRPGPLATFAVAAGKA